MLNFYTLVYFGKAVFNVFGLIEFSPEARRSLEDSFDPIFTFKLAFEFLKLSFYNIYIDLSEALAAGLIVPDLYNPIAGD